VAPRLAAAARSRNVEALIRVTHRAGEETGFAEEAVQDGWPLVVAAGGDGTVHNVVNGLLAHGPTNTVMGHIPIGSGNDYARSLGFRRGSVERNFHRMLDATPRRMDVGRVAGEYFVNGMGVGFDAEVVRQTLRMSHLTGFAMYLTAVYRTFGIFTPPEIEVVAEEHRERARIMLFAIGIAPFAGGGFRLTPRAEADDGFLDACLIRQVGLLRFLRDVPRVVRGTHGTLDEVTMFRTKRVRVTGLSGPLAMHLDGELRYPEEQTIEIEILPHHLMVLCAA